VKNPELPPEEEAFAATSTPVDQPIEPALTHQPQVLQPDLSSLQSAQTTVPVAAAEPTTSATSEQEVAKPIPA